MLGPSPAFAGFTSGVLWLKPMSSYFYSHDITCMPLERMFLMVQQRLAKAVRNDYMVHPYDRLLSDELAALIEEDLAPVLQKVIDYIDNEPVEDEPDYDVVTALERHQMAYQEKMAMKS